MQQRNFVLFLAMMFLIFMGWMQLKMRLWPPVPAPIEEKIEEPKSSWVTRCFETKLGFDKKAADRSSFVPVADRPVAPRR